MENKLEILKPEWLGIWLFIIILGAAAFPYGVEIWIVGIVVAFILISERKKTTNNQEPEGKKEKKVEN